MKHILIVEDDTKYLAFLEKVLKLNHYEVITADNPVDGIELYEKNEIDLIISDLKMEPVDGLQFLYLVREVDEQAKIIFLTSSEDEEDEVKGLSLMANDFVHKNVSIKVLLKRIELALSTQIVFKNKQLISDVEQIIVDIKTRRVLKDGAEVKLAMREYDLLVWFLKNKNIVLEIEQIVREVWQVNEEHIDVRTIDTHVKRLRKKLEISCIFSVRGVGYEWVE